MHTKLQAVLLEQELLLQQELPVSIFITLVYWNFYHVRILHTRRPYLDALSLINTYNDTKSLPAALETADSHVAAWKAHNISLFSCSSTCSFSDRPASLNSVGIFFDIFLKKDTPFYLTCVNLFCFSNCALARYSVFVLAT